MTFTLLFDSRCPGCSQVAKRVRDLQIEELDVEALDDPGVRQALEGAGQPVPTKPVLIHRSGDRVRVWTGLAMRLRLARLIGIRRAADLLALLTAETRARIDHAAETAFEPPMRNTLGRRRILGGTAAGVGALILGSASRSAAASNDGSANAPLSAAMRERALRSRPVREAIAAYGDVYVDHVTVDKDKDGRSFAAVPHHNGTCVTFVEVDVAEPIALTLVIGGKEKSVRYCTTTGVPLVELAATADGQVVSQVLATGDRDPHAEGSLSSRPVCTHAWA